MYDYTQTRSIFKKKYEGRRTAKETTDNAGLWINVKTTTNVSVIPLSFFAFAIKTTKQVSRQVKNKDVKWKSESHVKPRKKVSLPVRPTEMRMGILNNDSFV